jgi:hypothetical protein
MNNPFNIKFAKFINRPHIFTEISDKIMIPTVEFLYPQ